MVLKLMGLIGVMLVSFSAQAEFYATQYYSTNYIYRGMSFYSKDDSDFSAKNGKSLFQTELGFYKKDQFFVSLFYGPVDTFNFDKGQFEKDQEIDAVLGWTKKINDDVTFGAGVSVYSYFSNKSNNMQDYNLSLSYKVLKAEVSYIPDYAGFGTRDLYARLGVKIPVAETLGVMGHVGRSSFSDESRLGMTSYTDYKVGAYWTPFEFLGTELYYTGTRDRNVMLLQETMKDETLTFTIYGSVGF